MIDSSAAPRVGDSKIVFAVRFAEVPLRGPLSVRRAAHWIKREIDQGVRAAIVVGTCWRIGRGREADRMRAAGDQVAAAMLAASLTALDVSARSLDVRDVELEGDGEFGGGILRHLDGRYVAELLARGVTPVIPGGHVHRADGEIVTLASGRVDLTAVALAVALGRASCHVVSVGKRSASSSGSGVSPDALVYAQAHEVPVLLRTIDSASLGAAELVSEAVP